MLKRETISIADIYVPVKRRATLDQKRVDEIATSMLDKGQQAPVQVRADGARFVLVEGLYRLEAGFNELGESLPAFDHVKFQSDIAETLCRASQIAAGLTVAEQAIARC